jgi:hypothetical protein
MVINLQRQRRPRRRLLPDFRGGWRWRVVRGHYRKDMEGGKRYRCFLNGVEITRDTFYVDTRRGIVRVHKRNEEGRIYLDPATHRAAWEEKRGNVKLVRAKAA